ncbi:NADH-quinone oxidoreductase subunit L, partial [Actinomadura sp. KC216]|uniref:proton-conducting transporter transmembrane domain-containing protein n=1 Tax=Actinomadura sp. KC216 TaxID=2530370 RepID=UPI0010452602
WGSGLAVDGLSAVLLVTLAVVLVAVLAYAAADGYGVRFYVLVLLFGAAMAVTVTASDLLLLLMGWEVMGAMSYALIGYAWPDAERVRSADIAFLTTRAADMGLYAAAGFAVAGAHSLRLDALAQADAPWRNLIAAGVVVSALGKSAQLPFSFWLSRAMAGPTPVSALLHSATMVVAGAYLLLRLRPLLDATGWAATAVSWAGALTALLLGAVALAQRDLKQLLAASTCAQIGFMVLGAGAGAAEGGAAHLVAHAAVKSSLFLCAGVWLTRRGSDRLVDVVFGVGAIALAGVPPLSLWVTKDAVLGGVGERSPALLGVGFAASVLSAAYAGKAVLWLLRPGERVRVPVSQRIPLAGLGVAAACLGGVLGVFGLPGISDDVTLKAWEMALSGVLAVLTVGVVVAVRERVPEPAWALDWLRLERAAVVVVARPTLAAARALVRFDDRVVDGAVRAVARGGRWTAGLTGRRVELPLDGLVALTGRAARGLAALARRPQTGQLHLYYAQAAVVLAVLAVIAVLAG